MRSLSASMKTRSNGPASAGQRLERRAHHDLDQLGQTGAREVRAGDLRRGAGRPRASRAGRPAAAPAPARSCCSRRASRSRGSPARRTAAPATRAARPGPATRRRPAARPPRSPPAPRSARPRPARGAPRGSRRPPPSARHYRLAMRARSVASSRPSAASTASMCSAWRPPSSAARAAPLDRLAVLAQLVEAPRDRLGPAPALELRERRVEPGRELERRLAPAALVEVEPRAQRQLLAGEGDVAARQQRGEALLRVQEHRARRASAAAARARPPSRPRRPARPSRSRCGWRAPGRRGPRRRRGPSPPGGGRGSCG